MRITLDELLSFDPHSPDTSPQRRFKCPECNEPSKPRSLTVNVLEGIYICFRCGLKGKLGDEAYCSEGWSEERRRQRELEASLAKQQDRARRIKQLTDAMSTCVHIAGTPGMAYLESRGITEAVAIQGNVLYSEDLFGRQAIVFPVQDESGKLVGMQARYIDGREPRMRSAGFPSQGLYYAYTDSEDSPNILTEAPIDALSLVQLGGKRVAATLGCQLGDAIANAVKSPLVHIATDADKEGDKAALRWAKQLAANNIRVQRRRPPKGCKDWNEYLQQKISRGTGAVDVNSRTSPTTMTAS